ncbi:MAG: 50S ribosomal protein L24 [Candidatus Altimarinota bacterium]
MKLKVNDNVLVITGKDKGKKGKILKVDRKNDRITVEKVNLRTKHIKKRFNQPGEKISYEAPMAISNVMILCPKTDKPTRIGYKVLASGKKERIALVSGASLDTATATKSKSKKVKA